jgi:hypothetical protein
MRVLCLKERLWGNRKFARGEHSEVSAMSETDFGAAILARGGEKLDTGGLKNVVEMLAQAKLKPDQGFRKSIDDAIAVVHAEWKAQRERELAERRRLEKARQKAIMVREIMILPQLNDLCTDFATDDENVLPNWQVQSGGDADAIYAMAVTPAIDDGGPSCFTIKAGASVAEQGATLNLTVECSCVDAQNLSTGKARQICEKTKPVAMLKFDDLGSEMWFHKQLEECARMCVLTRMRYAPRGDEEFDLRAELGV